MCSFDSLAFSDHRYGIGDLKALAADTHKFESRYLDRLVGPLSDAASLYEQRSPIARLDALSCPVLFLQGSDDKVVPPNQAHAMVDAMRARHLPVAYAEFAGEGHGFRQAANIRRSYELELSFYAQVFHFPLPADDACERVTIENL